MGIIQSCFCFALFVHWDLLFHFHWGGWGSSGFLVNSVIRIKTREILSGFKERQTDRQTRSESFGYCNHLEWAFHVSLIYFWWSMLEYVDYMRLQTYFTYWSLFQLVCIHRPQCVLLTAGNKVEKQYIYFLPSIRISGLVLGKPNLISGEQKGCTCIKNTWALFASKIGENLQL